MYRIRHLLGRWLGPKPSPGIPPDLPCYLLRDIGLHEGFGFCVPESIRACNKPVYVNISLGHLYR